MDSKKARRKSARKWDPGSERALLEIWSEKMGKLRGCRKNGHILLEMVADLQAQGYKYTVVELQTKMHNVTARYRKEKRKMRTSGGSPSEWDLFKEVGLLLASYKSYNSEGLVVDSINNIKSSIMSHPVSPSMISPMPSPSMTVSSPLPSPSMPASPSTPVDSPSPFMTADTPSPAASSTAAMKKKEGLDKLFKNLEKNIKKIYEDIKNTSEQVIAIEEEKKEMLKKYIDREAEVQKALIEFLKRS